MKPNPNNRHQKNDSGTLTSQIKETESQIIDRRHCVHVHTDTLINDLRREIRSPAALVLAAELGFMLGELTKSPPESERPAAESKPQVEDFDATPLKRVINVGSLMLTLYHALPLVWIMDTFHPEAATETGSAAVRGKAEKSKYRPPSA